MFNSLTGTVTGKFAQKVYIDTHGIEWDVTVPDSALDALPPVGGTGRVFVWLQHTDALMSLYGFASESQRALFFDLLKVDGIGPKAAIKILSGISESQLAAILEEGNVDALQKVPGVGKKTAQKMLLQLKGKLSLDQGSPAATAQAHPFADVVDALCNMGFDRRDVTAAVDSVLQRLAKDAEFSGASRQAQEDTLLRTCLVELSR